MASLREQLIVDLDRARTGYGEVSADAVMVTSPTCGDEVAAQIEHDGGVIRALTWHGHGCTVSMASASALAALVPGITLTEFAELKEEFIDSLSAPTPESDEVPDGPLGDAAAFTGIGRLPLRARCASLAWEATAQALIR